MSAAVSDPGRPAAGEAPAAVLARKGKSFHFACQFLDAGTAAACARLYAFCRRVDDIADGALSPARAQRRLQRLHRDVAANASSRPWVADFLALCASHGLDRQPALTLIETVMTDCGDVALADEADLLRYAYGVAGTVGLMLNPLLGASDPRARHHAVDLGIAMQLTNIARDVADDAGQGRRYLPGTLVGNLTPAEIAAAPEDIRPRLQSAVHTVLARAEGHYESAEDGIAYLPGRVRPGILVAARVYRAIGARIAARDYATWQGRAVVSRPARLAIAARALADLACSPRYRRPGHVHRPALHQPLHGLPGVNAQPAGLP